MKLGEIKNADKYQGLYVVDFGDTSTVGLTAGEVGQLLESEKFKDIKVYKIHNASPDGTMELKGVPNDIFNLEMGMFFYGGDEKAVKNDYQQLVSAGVKIAPPARANVQLAKYSDDKYAVAIIYPAEYNDEFSAWLIEVDYKTAGAADGGIDAATRYYANSPEILERHQMFPQSEFEDMEAGELLAATKRAIAR